MKWNAIRVISVFFVSLILVFTGCKKATLKKGKNHSANQIPSPTPTLTSAPSSTSSPTPDLGGPAVRGFLTADELITPSLGYVTPSNQIANAINAQKGFEQETHTVSTKTNCYTRAFDKAKVIASKNFFEIAFDFSKNDTCFNDQKAADAPTYSNVEIHYVWKVSCPGVDLSKYDGINRGTIESNDIKTSDLCKTLPEAYVLRNYSFQATVDGQYAVKTTKGTMKGDGTGCKIEYKNGERIINKCVIFSKTIYNIQPGKTYKPNYYFRAEFKDIVAKYDKPFYEAGSLKFHLNGWDGEMIYNDGLRTPVWKASHGTSQSSGEYSSLR